MKDIEIARSIVPKKINEVTTRLGIPDEYIEQYGKYKAKISNKYMNELTTKANIEAYEKALTDEVKRRVEEFEN